VATGTVYTRSRVNKRLFFPARGCPELTDGGIAQVRSAEPEAAAFRAEAAALAAVTAGLTEDSLRRPSLCPPWTVADLLGHIVIAAGRIGPAIEAAGQAPAADRQAASLVDAAGYYRPGERFSAAVNADRIGIAVALAARLGTATALTAELTRVCAQGAGQLESAAPGHQVRTRHGDWMLLADFAVTRVVELAVHGLDVAAGLDRAPWLTSEAAGVLERLLLPGTGPAGLAELRGRLGCDRAGLVAVLTGRHAVSPAGAALLARAGVTRLAFG
jgi:uncharacterized protein (TIGR03083 family)